MSFEPVKASYANLLENVRRRTRFDNVTALNVAVGKPRVLNEKAVIRIPGDDFTQASLMPHTVGSWDEDAGGHAYDCTITSDELIEEVLRLQVGLRRLPPAPVRARRIEALEKKLDELSRR